MSGKRLPILIGVLFACTPDVGLSAEGGVLYAMPPMAAVAADTGRADSSRVKAVRVYTDSNRAETCRGGVLQPNGNCSGRKQAPRTTFIVRFSNKIDSIEQASLQPAPAPVPDPVPPPDTVVPPPPPPPPTTGVAELPRTVPASADPYPGRGCSTTVPSGGDVNAALRAARGGSVVCLTPSGSYAAVTLPCRATADTGSIVLRTGTTLPPEGQRVRPSTATGFAVISVANADPPLTTCPGTFGWYVAGIRVTTTGSLTFRLVELGRSGAEQDVLVEVPQKLILSRVVIDGANAQIQRCIALNSGATAIVDSWLANCHIRGFEGQGIGGWNGPGPYLIRNNHIEASGINILFGGSTPSIAGLRTLDVTIQRNHIYKPLAWKGVWTVKNLLETKNAGRVLIEENVLENSWTDGQTGLGVLFKSSNDQGTCNWCQTTDVTYRRNMLRGAETGMSVTAGENYCRNAGAIVGPGEWCQVRGEVPPPTSRVVIQDNVFDDLGNMAWGAKGFYFAPVHSTVGMPGIVIERNVTAQGAGKLVAHGIAVDSPGAPNGVFRDNVVTNGAYPIVSDGHGFGLEALTAGAPGYQWSNNWFVKLPNHTGGTFPMPAGTTIVSSESAAALAAQIRSTVSAATSGVVVPP